MGLWLPKNGHKGRDANNSLKRGVCQKGGKAINGGVVGNVYNAKTCFAKIRINRIY